MEAHWIVGFALLAGAVSEAVVGLLVVGPKVPPEKRPLVVAALLLSAVMMAGLGIAFLMRWIPVGGA